jgi:hypothetical protein
MSAALISSMSSNSSTSIVALDDALDVLGVKKLEIVAGALRVVGFEVDVRGDAALRGIAKYGLLRGGVGEKETGRKEGRGGGV